ncbi:MurR/RpiR family transcriptional regulator [Megasphaera sueciensis]|jgi:DNA-binding MurR/RpiR family transcriptional regulator|uniref:MurR/RpiR family transcriptional regulator n=1 Tax=Megasphaera sueciensis TaxID=349094 RepID=UPI003D0785EF|nr:MurR/RpiR family transcriptional regulator [Megasphaera sp.]
MANSKQPPANCLLLLLSNYPYFTKSQQKIADYISENPHEAIRQSISEIAESTASSEITVSRFCHKAGFNGLQDLKIALASEIFTPLESVCQDINTYDTVQEIASKVFYNTINSLQDTLKDLDSEAVNKAIDLIYNAHKIDVYGYGVSSGVAKDIENHLLRYSKPVHAFSDLHMQVTSATLLTSEDVVIIVSHSGSNLDLITAAKLAKANHAKIIVLTSYKTSTLCKLADIILCGAGREVTYRSEATASRLVHLALMDIIYTGLMMKDPDKFTKNMNKMRLEIAKRRV